MSRLGFAARGLGIAACVVIAGTGTANAAGSTANDAAGRHTTVVAPVLRGVQIYRCTEQPDGSRAFTQHDVKAKLKYGIRHTFVQPTAGPPQWVAPDGSAVTAERVSSTPNGPGNIPELELKATQTGRPRGLLAKTVRILRLNTEGGVAPAGSCDLGAIARVPYRADYVFLSE